MMHHAPAPIPDTERSLQWHIRDNWIARGAILVTAVLNALLINNLSSFPWWLASAVELALLVPLSIVTAWTHGQMRRATHPHHWTRIRHHGRRVRHATLALTAIITLINFQSLYAVLAALLNGTKPTTGHSLLIDALNIWFTNVVVFALWFWNIDRGGPALRSLPAPPPADLMFPQMGMAPPRYRDWRPAFLDYLFVSFTNATAFSPTDTLPLTVRAKLLFMVESGVSLITVGMVAARAVNILS